MIRLLLALALMLNGCRACEREPKQLVEPKAKLNSRFYLSQERLLGFSPQFSFESELELILVSSDSQKVSREQLKIDGSGHLIHFTKKIDEAHYFELIRDGDRYAIKNRQGPWRDGRDNKIFLAELIDEGLNLTTWLFDQCAVPADLKIDTLLSAQAPLIKNMPTEARISNCRLSGQIQVNAEDLPLATNFMLLCEASSGGLKLSIKTKLSKNSSLAAINMPIITENEPLLYPVNIAPKLLDLLK